MEENPANPTGSILDQVLSRKQLDAIEHFSPLEVMAMLLKLLTSREEEVLRRRYGLQGKPPETLEHIGSQYNVTRERIRQIESGAIAKLRKHHDLARIVKPIADAVRSLLDQYGGVLGEETLLQHLVGNDDDSQTSHAATLFIIRNLLQKEVRVFSTEADTTRPAWQLASAPTHLVTETMRLAEEVLAQQGKPVAASDLLAKLRETPFVREHTYQLTDAAIQSYVDLHRSIAKNPYDEYGLVQWGSIVPKRMNDKIYLVLKKSGKPLHFNEITRLINETHFDHRTAYPPTVHNELILNERYVLVGRGIYALKEWGYRTGVVADILVETLKAAAHPMTRDELVEAVLKQRLVKRNTIHLALTNRKRFQKHPDGTYSLVQAAG